MHIRLKSSRSISTAVIFSFLVGIFTLLAMPRAQAQTRINDHDMKALMQNLRDDAKSFRPEFDRAIEKSSIRKTSQAKDARDQAKVFVRQTEHLVNRFKKDRNGQAEFNDVMTTAEQLNAAVHSVHLSEKTMERWHKIRTELRRIAHAYGVPDGLNHGDMR